MHCNIFFIESSKFSTAVRFFARTKALLAKISYYFRKQISTFDRRKFYEKPLFFGAFRCTTNKKITKTYNSKSQMSITRMNVKLENIGNDYKKVLGSYTFLLMSVFLRFLPLPPLAASLLTG